MAGILAVGLLLLLAGSTTTSALTADVSIVNVEYVNKLSKPLTLTLLAAVLGSERSTVIPPGKSVSVPETLQGPTRQSICFQVGPRVYHTSGTVQSTAIARAVGETGTVTISITGFCYMEKPGLRYVVTALGVQVNEGCAELDVERICPASWH